MIFMVSAICQLVLRQHLHSFKESPELTSFGRIFIVLA